MRAGAATQPATLLAMSRSRLSGWPSRAMGSEVSRISAVDGFVVVLLVRARVAELDFVMVYNMNLHYNNFKLVSFPSSVTFFMFTYRVLYLRVGEGRDFEGGSSHSAYAGIAQLMNPVKNNFNG